MSERRLQVAAAVLGTGALLVAGASAGATDRGSDPRLRLRASSHYEVAAGRVGGYALRRPDGSKRIQEAPRRPLRLHRRIPVSARGRVFLRLRVPANALYVSVLDNNGRRVSRVFGARQTTRSGRKWVARVPRRVRRSADRLRVAVEFRDRSAVSFDVGVKLHRHRACNRR